MGERFSEEGLEKLRSLPIEDLIRYWDAFEKQGKGKGKVNQAMRLLALNDLYYLLVRILGRKDLLPCVGREGFVDNQFIFERVREVEKSPDGHLDLWGREHGKSSVLTFGLTIQNILQNPDITIGIFSHTRPIAKAFLRQIMREFESNKALNLLFPDVLWSSLKDAPKWSEDDGIIVRRKSNPNEGTVEAWGLVDGQPTSKHFKVLLYDDIVVAGSVTTPEMIAKTMTELERSYNLGTTPGIKRMIGTRWHFNDAYRTVIDRQTLKLREYPGKVGNSEDGKSVLWSEETHAKKRAEMGPYTYAAQILLNPKADILQGFKREWLKTYERVLPERMNKYLLVDAASEKKKSSDYTAMWIVGLNSDGNYYVLDIVRDRLNLAERAAKVFELHRRWKPIETRYEKYGMMADIEHLKTRMELENYRFDIKEVAGITAKPDRIKRLIPIFESGRLYLPKSLYYTDYQRVPIDLVRSFIEEEYMAFPLGLHEDMLDALSRIAEPELKLSWPKEAKVEPYRPPTPIGDYRTAWMS